MVIITSIAIGLVSVLAIVYAYFKHSFNYFKSRGIPTVEPTIPYGNLKNFGKIVHSSLFMKKFYDKFKGTAKFCGIYFFSRPVIFLLDLDLVKNVLVKDFWNFIERGLYYNEEDDPLSAHLFALDGKKWKKLRAKLTPTFTSGKMKFMFPTVVDVGDRFRDCLADVVKENDELEIKDLLARFTTDVIGTCAFGIECNSLKDPNAEFRKMGRSIFGQPRHRTLVTIFLGNFRNLARKLHMKNMRDDLAEFFMGIVTSTVEYREKNKINRNDFMDLLIKLKNEEPLDNTLGKLTLNEIAAQAFVFFFAGFDTSSTTMAFCLYELSVNPDIQTKARQIIRDTLKRHDGKFTYETMMDMSYIDHILHETLRKYPPVANLTRLAENDYRVPDTDHVIEKGTFVLIPVYSIQHDEEYYPNPEKFDPDRFSIKEVSKRDLMTWLPFGEGPRNCIGLRFGMMQARIGLVTLLNNFEFSVCERTPKSLTFAPEPFTLSSNGGLYLKVKKIN